MGEALEKFLNQNQIIIGGAIEEKKYFKTFKKFKSKKFYLNLNEAIITKMAINIYLSLLLLLQILLMTCADSMIQIILR